MLIKNNVDNFNHCYCAICIFIIFIIQHFDKSFSIRSSVSKIVFGVMILRTSVPREEIRFKFSIDQRRKSSRKYRTVRGLL